jgi:RNA polymerase II subunit A small phosphatase-like protein
LKIELDKKINDIHVLKRTGVDDFLLKMAEFYEIIIFTASLSKVNNK